MSIENKTIDKDLDALIDCHKSVGMTDHIEGQLQFTASLNPKSNNLGELDDLIRRLSEDQKYADLIATNVAMWMGLPSIFYHLTEDEDEWKGEFPFSSPTAVFSVAGNSLHVNFFCRLSRNAELMDVLGALGELKGYARAGIDPKTLYTKGLIHEKVL